MATIRDGNKTALLVVDVQVGVMRSAWDSARVISNVVRAVEKARASQIPVIWVQHNDDEMQHGSADWQLVPELVPAADEVRIDKHYNSSFEETGLEDALRSMGVSKIVLAGAATNWCIRATAYGALDRGYDLTLIKDAHTTESIDLGNGHTIEAAGIIMDLNVAMKWLSYPGRTNQTVSAEELAFAG
jgi:nicotinamidase-related amidase